MVVAYFLCHPVETCRFIFRTVCMDRACRALEGKPPNSKDSPKTSQRPVGSQHWRRKWNFKFQELFKVKIVILSSVVIRVYANGCTVAL